MLFCCLRFFSKSRQRVKNGVLGTVIMNQARGYKTFFILPTQWSRIFILFINVKMPTIVGILTFISMINTLSERLKARNFFVCWYFSFCEQLKFCAQLGRV